MSLPQNVVTVTAVLPHHIFREIFSISAVITVVTVVLPLSLLLCHPLTQAQTTRYAEERQSWSRYHTKLYTTLPPSSSEIIQAIK